MESMVSCETSPHDKPHLVPM
ncbi:PHIKZ144.1 [Pseudomonas phage phiKZ]|uniref:PHIKZ144.1 n=1 Tax=Pseudomonas phage phiKZ TaxID=2905945 RepID=L7SZ22_BPDPK|nr:PHIKZ144.1 [Pseudomonas phage phiKZ]AGC26336.1 PHIKZ144.1 [Pseudomonas phage phiKZ]